MDSRALELESSIPSLLVALYGIFGFSKTQFSSLENGNLYVLCKIVERIDEIRYTKFFIWYMVHCGRATDCVVPSTHLALGFNTFICKRRELEQFFSRFFHLSYPVILMTLSCGRYIMAVPKSQEENWERNSPQKVLRPLA